MPDRQEDPKPLTLEEFESMSVDDKLKIFTNLSVEAQKLLVGCSAFASTVNPVMAIPVSKLSSEEFDKAKKVLGDTPFFSEVEGRLKVVDQMKQFINTDLKRIWEEQKT